MALFLTRAQIRRVDQLAVERYGISGLMLMENAGRNAADRIHESHRPAGAVVVFCGVGNNGGDGCVIARHLHNAGWSVRMVIVGDPARATPDMKTNFDIVQAMGLDIRHVRTAAACEDAVRSITSDCVVVDALLGTGFRGTVREPTAALIAGMNAAEKRAMVAIDVPSGLDCDTGEPSNATVRADHTVTFVAGKTGFSASTARPYLGRVDVVDIGAPRELPAEVAAVASDS